MTIVFIDDDSDDTELFCEAVAYLNSSEFISGKKEPIECIPVNNGAKALTLLPTLAEVPAYIFLDINMPVMGGRETLAHLKKDPKFAQIPVIMFSTAFRGNDASEFKTLGAYACIAKPSGFKELVKVLSKYVYEKYS
jgi:CheY-like chemotaxis protein